jgi:hypothetical protein
VTDPYAPRPFVRPSQRAGNVTPGELFRAVTGAPPATGHGDLPPEQPIQWIGPPPVQPPAAAPPVAPAAPAPPVQLALPEQLPLPVDAEERTRAAAVELGFIIDDDEEMP